MNTNLPKGCPNYDDCCHNGKHDGSSLKCQACSLYYQHIFVAESSRDCNGKIKRNIPFDSCDDYYDYEDYRDN